MLFSPGKRDYPDAGTRRWKAVWLVDCGLSDRTGEARVAYALGVLAGRLVFAFLVMLVIGGVYYLISRPRVTFRQAVFRWWVVLMGFAVLIISVAGQMAGS